MWLFGPYRKYGRVDWKRVKRVVFVCRGNICRSPFAQLRCEAIACPFPVTSFGLSTTTGVAADETAAEVAWTFGVDLSTHRAVDLKDFTFRSGDLLLAMEDRHIQVLELATVGRNVQFALLGLWYRPYFASLYDPYSLSPGYFASCFRRIDSAVVRLAEDARNRVAS